LRAAFGDERQIADILKRVADLTRIAHIDRKALQSLDCLADVVPTDGGRHDALDVRDVQAVAGRRDAVDLHVNVATAGQPLGERGSHAGDLRYRPFDFDSQAKILLEFSNDREALERAIKRTEAGGSTSLYNAVYTAISGLRRIGQETGPENRRYAIVLLSDGEDTSSIVPYDDVLDLAKRAGVVVYAIGLREKLKPGASHTTGWKQAEYDLKQLSGDTGGKVFFADDAAQLPSYYSQIADELSNQYTLGYISKNSKRDGAWRKILVRVSRPNMTARTKAGYFGPTVPR